MKKIEGDFEPIGKHKTMNEIHLNLPGQQLLCDLPDVDPQLQDALESIIPDRQKNYSVALMDISPCGEMRYAARLQTRGYQPGSVGKLAIVTGLFRELENIYPESFEKAPPIAEKKTRESRRLGHERSPYRSFF